MYSFHNLLINDLHKYSTQASAGCIPSLVLKDGAELQLQIGVKLAASTK